MFAIDDRFFVGLRTGGKVISSRAPNCLMIPFTKMHGLGNEIIVIDNRARKLHAHSLPITQLADRSLGVGCDQVLIIEPSEQADFFCHIFNADGSEAMQCGNGLRCVARFIHEGRLHLSNHFVLETKAGLFPVSIEDYEHITVNMGVPIMREGHLHLPSSSPIPAFRGDPVITIVAIGNNHAIVRVPTLQGLDVAKLGQAIAAHPDLLHEEVNVGFVEVLHTHAARLRTFERGAGVTEACGSNACATTAAGIVNGWFQSPVEIIFPQGALIITSEGENQPLFMCGPAVRMTDGAI